MTSRPAISVVIPCYNAARFIGETLESVFTQRGVQLEVVVVDDGSDDDSAGVVRAEFPQARVCRIANRGPSAARQFGTELSSGEFVQYVDADDLLGPGKLLEQARALEQSGSGVAYGDWVEFRSACGVGRGAERLVSKTLGPQPDIDLFTDFWAPLAAYLVRRELALRVGWHPRLPVIQDARFVLDCALLQARFVYCRGIMAYYRKHEGGSVSTRDRPAFIRDVLANAVEIAKLWTAAGMFDGPRREAVARVCFSAAQASATGQPEVFERACDLLSRAAPHSVPEGSWRLRAATRVLGCRRALKISGRLRRRRGR